jgi:hypothetical protein
MSDWLAPYPDPMTIDDLAQALGLSTRTLERRLRAGLSMPKELRRMHDARGSRRRWLKADVLAWATRDEAAEVPVRRAHFRSHLRRTA